MTYVEFLSTLSLRRATSSVNTADQEARISIHALLAESDLFRQNYECFRWIFLSTLSLRRATPPAAMRSWPRAISIHALLAESDVLELIPLSDPPSISIHALLAESDPAPAPPGAACRYFYPRSPCGERHRPAWISSTKHSISIHALLAESDQKGQSASIQANYFYPRSPCGERQCQYKLGWFQYHFYPRSPCGERRRSTSAAATGQIISIHALLAESDSKSAQNSGALLRI